jgi:hypothetical protein
MPLSSVVGAQSIVRPGVCTSSTRPASPYDGQVIYETDTDKTLVWNGSAWVYLSTSRTNATGLDLVASATVSSASSFSLAASTFTDTYDNYKIIGAFTMTASGSSQTVTMRMRASGTDNSNSEYRISNMRGFSAISGATAASSLTTSFSIVPAMTAPNRLNFALEIYNPKATDYTAISGTVGALQDNADMFSILPTGVMTVTTSYDSASFILSSGAFTGEYRVYGYANS